MYREDTASGSHLIASLTERLPAPYLHNGLRALRQQAGLEEDKSVELRPVSGRANMGAARANDR